ncbi:hypothetical protein Tco_0722323 [Tanacetum coccineum]
MSWFSRCSWCGGPFNSGNCPHCTNVSFGDEPVYDSNPNSYNQTPNFSNPLPHHNYETKLRSDTGAAFQAEFAKLRQNFKRFMTQQSCSYCGGPFNGGNCPSCSILGAKNEFFHDLNPFPYNNTPDFYDQPPQPQYQHDSHYGFDCPPRLPLVYEPECEIKIDELKAKFNKMSIEINKITKEKEFQQREQVANLSTHTPEPSRRFNFTCYDDDEERNMPLSEIISQLPPSIVITTSYPIKDPEDSLIMRNEELNTISEKESDKFIKSSVEDLVLIPSESEDTSGSDSEYDLPFCDDSPPLDVLRGNFVTFSNPLFDSNEDFTSSDNESLSYEDVLEDKNIERGKIDEIDAFPDIDISMDIENGYHDSEGDIIYLESLLINDTIPNLPPEVFLDHEPRSLNNKPDNLKSMVKVFYPEIHEKTFSPTYVRSEDTIFDPDISAFNSLEPVCDMRRLASFLSRVSWLVFYVQDCPDYKDSRARATKKTQRNLLKQKYEKFTAPSLEMLDQTFDRLQNLVSQLELLIKAFTEDVKSKVIKKLVHLMEHTCCVKESSRRSVPVETSTSTALVSCDGLGGYDWSDQAEEGPNYALMAYSSSSSDSEVSNDSNCSKSCMETVKLLKSQNDQLLRDLEKSSLMVLGYKTGLESVEEKLEFYKKNESVYVEKINGLKWDIQVGEITISELRKKLEKLQKEKDSIQFNVDKFENASKSLDKLIECQIVDNCKKGLGYEKYNAVPPPYTGNFMPPTPDLSFTGLDEFVNKPVVENRKSDEEVSEIVRKNNDAPIIEEWVSDSEEENVSQPKTEKKTVKPSIAKIEFVKHNQQEKTARKIVKQAEKHRQNTHIPRGNKRNWNNMMSQRLGSNIDMFNKACYVCGSFDNLQIDCHYHQQQFQNQRMGNPQMDLQDKGVIDSGCSRHMTGNMSYLTDYEEIDRGYVAFGGKL